MPRTMCGPAWTDGLVAWQVSSNAVIAICYLGIAAWLIAHRRMLPIGMLWVLFSSFIAMCALTHLSDLMMFVYPAYRADAVIRVLCAGISVVTLVSLPGAGKALTNYRKNKRRQNRADMERIDGAVVRAEDHPEHVREILLSLQRDLRRRPE